MTPDLRDLQPLLPRGLRAERIVPLGGDGSVRRFFRVHADADTCILCVGPETEENDAYVRLAFHLAGRGVRVPEIHGYDPARGWVVMQDLGDRNLYQAVREASDSHRVEELYRPVLQQLCTLQVEGGREYDPGLGQFSAAYDAEIMVAEEGMYFAREFAGCLLDLAVPEGFERDVKRLAQQGGRAPAGFLLHRDFQSRNVQLTPAGPAIIDFQGCRPGPLAYDVAALVLDPYVALPRALRQRLVAAYRKELAGRGVDPAAFDAGWFAVGSFRLLQALGAFAKLGGRFGKPGFLEHAAAGLEHLLDHLGERGADEYPSLHRCVCLAREAWQRRQP